MLFANTFLTIEKPAEIIFKDKGSKFLAFVFPVINDVQIKEALTNLKKKHPTANHHCYAYRLGADMQNYRVNDDGEPNNTAGKPILGQLQSKKLTNVLLVVVRYFGGTLLGVGGLINAYKTAANEVLLACNVIEKHIEFNYTITFNFEQLNNVMIILKQCNCKITQQQFDTLCKINFTIKKYVLEQCEEKLKKTQSLSLLLN